MVIKKEKLGCTMHGKYQIAIITPFKSNGEVDFEYFEHFLPLLEKNHAETIVAFGTNGEGPSMSVLETEKALKAILDFSGRMEVFLGVFRTNIPETIELIKLAEEYSISGVLLAPPFYYKNLKEEGLFQYYDKILNEFSLPVILYNIPKYTGISFTNNLIKKLSEFSQIIGIKDSSGDIEQTRQYIQNFPNFKIYSGSDALIHESLQLGCQGVITALSNAFPGIVNEIICLSCTKLLKEAEKLQNWLLIVRKITKQFPQVASIKICIEKYLGLPPTYVRPPLVNLNELQKFEMLQSLDKVVQVKIK
jgi:4-hydroxy-tetrahydrodipicolinate synthase